MTDPRVAAIEKRLSEATQGPWEFEEAEYPDEGGYEPPKVFSLEDPDNPSIICTAATRNGITEAANGALIANAPSDLRYLLDQLKAHTEAKETK